MQVKEILKVTNGKLIYGNEEIECTEFSRDTREIKKGYAYVGIKGESFDGNDFYKEAIKNGATICILEKVPKEEVSAAIIVVENTIIALEQIACYKREKYDMPVVGITGSVGKTSTKDLIASVVSEKYNTLKTKENYNNEIGVPLTVLSLKNEEAMVIEMGMDHYGELRRLTNVVKPTLVVLTNIGASHIVNFGSLENILKAKLEILEGLKGNTVIINNDNELLNKWAKENNEKYNIITYGMREKSDYMPLDIELKENSSKYKYDGETVEVPVGGEHFVLNSLCAIAVGEYLNMPLEKIIAGISKFKLSKNRMQIEKGIKGSIIIDDTYNANYDSMSAGVKYLKSFKNKRKIAVLGDMLNLGDYSKALHEKIGKEVDCNIDYLITVGSEARNIANESTAKEIFSFNSNKDAINKIESIISQDDVILVKASHAMNFIEIVEAIKEVL